MCLVCQHYSNNKIINKLIYLNSYICPIIKEILDIYPNLEGITLSLSFVQSFVNSKNLNKLKYLYANYSSLIELPSNAYNLLDLRINNCPIQHLPINFVNLKVLDCGNTPISNIPHTYINLTRLYINNTKINIIPSTLCRLKILDCSYTRINNISKKFILLERLNCQCSNVKVIPDSLINLKYLNCNFTNISFISSNFSKLIVLKLKHTKDALLTLKYKYPNIIKLQTNNFNYYYSQAREYIAINFLIYHFKTKFKFVNKFKFINKQSLLNYSYYILDSYLNPNSLAIIYRASNWDFEYKQLLYLTNIHDLHSTPELKIFKIE